ncbi:MAG: hypothetical protein U0Z53_13300 [Blastocatellia bacterium]
MKTSKTSSKKSLNGHAAPSRRRQAKSSARKKKKAEKELTADELTLIAWESLYKKRDKFISMWD